MSQEAVHTVQIKKSVRAVVTYNICQSVVTKIKKLDDRNFQQRLC